MKNLKCSLIRCLANMLISWQKYILFHCWTLHLSVLCFIFVLCFTVHPVWVVVASTQSRAPPARPPPPQFSSAGPPPSASTPSGAPSSQAGPPSYSSAPPGPPAGAYSYTGGPTPYMSGKYLMSFSENFSAGISPKIWYAANIHRNLVLNCCMFFIWKILDMI